MGFFSRTSKEEKKEKHGVDFLKEHRKNIAEKEKRPERAVDPRRLPAGPDGSFVFYEED